MVAAQQQRRVTARRISRARSGADAWVYQLSAPIDYDSRGQREQTEYVVLVSGWTGDQQRTEIFPADEQGVVLSYNELPGSGDGWHQDDAVVRAGWDLDPASVPRPKPSPSAEPPRPPPPPPTMRHLGAREEAMSNEAVPAPEWQLTVRRSRGRTEVLDASYSIEDLMLIADDHEAEAGGLEHTQRGAAEAALPADLRVVIGTLAHNRQFTTAEVIEYTRWERPEIAQHAEKYVRQLVREGLLERVGRGKYFPTRKGWSWIEGSNGAMENPRHHRGPLFRPLRWHREGKHALVATGKLGSYRVTRQRPNRAHGILPWVVALNDRPLRSFEDQQEAKSFGSHYDEIAGYLGGPAPTAARPVAPPPGAWPTGQRPTWPKDRTVEPPTARPSIAPPSTARPATAPPPEDVTVPERTAPTVPQHRECSPFLEIRRDPERFANCAQRAREIGPLDTPRKIFDLVVPYLAAQDQEVFLTLALDLRSGLRGATELKGLTEVARGQRSSVRVGIPDVMRAVIVSGGEMAVLLHCHPSATSARPSAADKQLTKDIEKAFEPYGRDLLLADHIIIASADGKTGEFYSFREKKLTRVS